MSRKFGRKVIVQLGNKSYEGLRVTFSINKTVSGEPNTADITIYNLGWTTVADLAYDYRNLRVRLLAGYESFANLLFEGNITHDGFEIDDTGTDRLLKIRAQTGIRRYQSARVNISFEVGTSYAQILREVARQMGYPSTTVIDTPELEKTIQTGVSFEGRASSYLDRLARTIGADWSDQDGSLQILPRGRFLPNTGPRFSPELGNLIGSPKPTDIGASITTLLEPITPGQRFIVDKTTDPRLSGLFRADSIQFTGDSGFDSSFYTVIEGRRINA